MPRDGAWQTDAVSATTAVQDAVLCGSTLTGTAIGVPRAEQLARVFKALGDPTRVRLVSLIAAHEGGQACVCDLTEPVGLSQPTVSHHLKLLVDAGLLSREQRGRWAYYRVVEPALVDLAATIALPTR